MDNYAQKRLQARLRLIRYLLSRADDGAFTHDEKHHLLEVALMEVHKAQEESRDENFSITARDFERDPDIDTEDLSDIPF